MDILLICIFVCLGILAGCFIGYSALTKSIIDEQEADYIALLEKYNKSVKKGGESK